MPTLIVVGLLFAGLVWFLVSTALRSSRLKNTPVTRIADCRVSGAQVRVAGKVVPLGTVTAPGSGLECVGYRIIAGDGVHSLTRVVMGPFLLDDGVERVLVDCGKANEGIAFDVEATTNETRLIKSIELDLGEHGKRKVTSLIEQLIVPGEPVTVFGEVQRRMAAPEPGSPVPAVRLVRPPKGPWLVSTNRRYLDR